MKTRSRISFTRSITPNRSHTHKSVKMRLNIACDDVTFNVTVFLPTCPFYVDVYSHTHIRTHSHIYTYSHNTHTILIHHTNLHVGNPSKTRSDTL